jgi:hypothetical protein
MQSFPALHMDANSSGVRSESAETIIKRMLNARFILVPI